MGGLVLSQPFKFYIILQSGYSSWQSLSSIVVGDSFSIPPVNNGLRQYALNGDHHSGSEEAALSSESSSTTEEENEEEGEGEEEEEEGGGGGRGGGGGEL